MSSFGFFGICSESPSCSYRSSSMPLPIRFGFDWAVWWNRWKFDLKMIYVTYKLQPAKDFVWWPAWRSGLTCRIDDTGSVSMTEAIGHPYCCYLVAIIACNAAQHSHSRRPGTRGAQVPINLLKSKKNVRIYSLIENWFSFKIIYFSLDKASTQTFWVLKLQLFISSEVLAIRVYSFHIRMLHVKISTKNHPFKFQL